MAKLFINAGSKKGHIHKDIYGHFSEHLGRCIYEGLYVGKDSDIPNINGMRKDVVDALKEMQIPVLRWPGGCFADEYHWKDGIGPKESRKKMINTHWGGVVEDNSFGTHEFFELCEQLGCDAYVNANLGSGTVQEMAEWVEYMTFDGESPMANLRRENGREKPWNVKYLGVGNESWGCGGNMTPEHYANEYRRYQTYVRDFRTKEQREAGIEPIQKIACGANVDDYRWTEEVLGTCFENWPRWDWGRMQGLSLHFYTGPSGKNVSRSAADFDEKVWYNTLKKTLYMETLIDRHGAIMDKYDPDKKIGMIIDEWGNWFEVEPGTNPGFLYQQNTMRDALVAGINLNLFNKHSDRVKMANIAQTINVLQSVILTEGEKMIKTPTYYVFKMYKDHQDGTLLESSIETKEIGLEKDYMVPNLSESVSVDKAGTIHITVANLSLDESYPVETIITDKIISEAVGEILTNKMDAKNTFEEPNMVETEAFSEISINKNGISFTIPPCSIVHIQIK